MLLGSDIALCDEVVGVRAAVRRGAAESLLVDIAVDSGGFIDDILGEGCAVSDDTDVCVGKFVSDMADQRCL